MGTVNFRMFSSIPGLYRLDASSTPFLAVTTKNVSKNCHMFPPRGNGEATLPTVEMEACLLTSVVVDGGY